VTRRGDVAYPAAFVVLWSTGFIAAKFGLPYATPFAFLLARFCAVAAIMTTIALVTRAPWPGPREALHTMLVGALIQCGYLGGVFFAIAHGASAGLSAMLVGLQPVVTVALARAWLGERIVARQWLGLALGVAGVALVVSHRVAVGSVASVVALTIALFAISVGTLWQKRHAAHVDLRTGAVIQFATSALLLVPLVLFTEDAHIDWTPSFAFALGWSVIVLSTGANLLLFRLIRHGKAADVAALFFLVPAVTALMAWALFGETLTVAAIAGMALIAAGVVLGRARRAAHAPRAR
jgi:drug/metabolite transporter (DMT)-like permease